MHSLSRRSLLKGIALTASTAPFVNLHSLVEDWHVRHNPSASTGGLRLNANENPYGPSAKAREAMSEAISRGNLYPWGLNGELAEMIADYEGLEKEQVLITAGSSEVLGLIGLVAGKEGGKVIGCHPTFGIPLHFAEQLGAQWVKVPLTEDQQYNLKGINEALDGDASLVYICNPNNPTGRVLPPSVLHPFCKTISERCMVLVDEAYIEFTKEGIRGSLASATADHPNLIIARTFSKIYGIAGLRVGYAIAHPDTISAIRPFLQGRGMTPSVCSMAAAMACVGDREFIEQCLRHNDESKGIVTRRFDQWGVGHLPSSTNFIMFRTDKFRSSFFEDLRERQIQIRRYGDVPGWARVSMGTPDDMQVFVNALESLRV